MGNLNPTTPGGTGSAAGLVIIAGSIAFLGNMKLDKSFPKDAFRIIASTLILAVIISFFDNGKLSTPTRWLGYLMVLSALIRYVPAFNTRKA